MRVIFMGTPDFSLPSLAAILNAGHTVAAVYCQPDKPAGRRHILTAPPVKVFAIEQGIAAEQPNTLRSETVFARFAAYKPDIAVVVAYGKILPKAILDIPSYGCINVHASLLPKYRGAAPVQRAILAGETETGVTTMRMDESLDTGDIFLQERVSIAPNETSGEALQKLAPSGASLLIRTLEEIDHIKPRPQTHAQATYAPPLRKEEGLLDLRRLSPQAAHNRIRGLSPWPGAYTIDGGGNRLKLLQSRIKENGELEILLVQPEGKRPMPFADYLRGHTL